MVTLHGQIKIKPKRMEMTNVQANFIRSMLIAIDKCPLKEESPKVYSFECNGITMVYNEAELEEIFAIAKELGLGTYKLMKTWQTIKSENL